MLHGADKFDDCHGQDGADISIISILRKNDIQRMSPHVFPMVGSPVRYSSTN